MNKGDLIEAVAKVTSTKKNATAAVDCIYLDKINSLVEKYFDKSISNFG